MVDWLLGRWTWHLINESIKKVSNLVRHGWTETSAKERVIVKAWFDVSFLQICCIFLINQSIFTQSGAPPQLKMQSFSNINGLIHNNVQVGASC